VAHARIVGQLIEPADLQAPLRFCGDVEAEIGEQIAAGDRVACGPGITDAVCGRGAGAGDDHVLRVHPGNDRVLDARAGHDRADRRVFRHVLPGLDRGCLQQSRNHGGEHLDMALTRIVASCSALGMPVRNINA
jgi:hypothetical protein